MSKKEKQVADEIDPALEREPGDASDLPATWEPETGVNLPSTQVTGSAALERSDFITPTLNLIAKNGDELGKFTPGSWVLNKEIQFTKEPGAVFQVVVLEHPRKFYMEHTEYDPNVKVVKRRFRTLEEVEAAGLTVEWDNVRNIRPTADRAALVTILVIRPANFEGEHGFGMAVEGLGKVTPASWLLVNTAYKYAAKRIFTTIAMDLEDKPIYSLLWNLKSELVKAGNYPVFAPILSPAKVLPDEVRASLKSQFNLA